MFQRQLKKAHRTQTKELHPLRFKFIALKEVNWLAREKKPYSWRPTGRIDHCTKTDGQNSAKTALLGMPIFSRQNAKPGDCDLSSITCLEYG